MGVVELREIIRGDLDLFFEHQRDPKANKMAAFTSADPEDRVAFDAHWARIGAEDSVIIRTITEDGRVVGSVLSFDSGGETEVSYWIERGCWGRGIASTALALFLQVVTTRPLHARAAKDNIGSAKVLARCGFVVVGADRGFANGRGEVVEEDLLILHK